uniref:Ankyrin repeat protein n=1 Tax=viral metagenome TaxID=1070528 RepID=A0A6C0EB81_9ZZZZ
MVKQYTNIRTGTYTFVDGFILSDKHNMFDIKIIKKLKLYLLDGFIDCASVLGHIHILEWWRNSGLQLEYSSLNAMHGASRNNKINALEWWKKSGLELSYSSWEALKIASLNNHISVLEWWKNSGLSLQVNPYQMFLELLITYFERGLMDVLRWWKHSGFLLHSHEYPNPIPYITCDIDKAYDKDYTDLIDWFISLKIYKIVYTNIPVDYASKMCNLNVLEWWKKSGLPLKYSEKALDNASKHGHINVLEWWFNNNLPLKYTKCAIDNASRHGHINVLEWWINSNLGLQYSKYALNMTIKKRNEKTLNWWINSGLPLKYSCKYKDIINIKIPKKTKIYSYYIL